MTDERFKELINGTVAHPLLPFTLARIALALRHVVAATGPDGDAALESYCQQLETRDRTWSKDDLFNM